MVLGQDCSGELEDCKLGQVDCKQVEVVAVDGIGVDCRVGYFDRNWDHYSGDRRSHHRHSHCCDRKIQERVEVDIVAGLGIGAGARSQAVEQAVVVPVAVQANDRQQVGS